MKIPQDDTEKSKHVGLNITQSDTVVIHIYIYIYISALVG